MYRKFNVKRMQRPRREKEYRPRELEKFRVFKSGLRKFPLDGKNEGGRRSRTTFASVDYSGRRVAITI